MTDFHFKMQRLIRFDLAGGVAGFTPDLFPELLLHDFDWPTWAAQLPKPLRQPPPNGTRRERVQWGLGVAPAAVTSPGGHYGEQCEPGGEAGGCYVSEMMTHTRFKGNAVNVTR